MSSTQTAKASDDQPNDSPYVISSDDSSQPSPNRHKNKNVSSSNMVAGGETGGNIIDRYKYFIAGIVIVAFIVVAIYVVWCQSQSECAPEEGVVDNFDMANEVNKLNELQRKHM